MRGVIFVALLAAAPSFAAQRVVTLSPHLAELVCAAGGCDQLAGVVAYSDYPPQVMQLPQVGDAFNLNLERLLTLKPDLVLSWEGGGGMQDAARLRSLGLRVEKLRVSDLDDIANALRQIGRWLGTSAIADAQATEVQLRLQSLRSHYRDRAPVKVFYQVQTEPLYTVSAGSPISQAIKLCGGVNAFAGLRSLAAPVGLEAVLAARPDVVIYAEQDEPNGRLFWERHRELQAAAAGRVYAVDANRLARSTPRMLDGVEQLCEAMQRAREKISGAGAPR